MERAEAQPTGSLGRAMALGAFDAIMAEIDSRMAGRVVVIVRHGEA
jgi:hypothetical protein